MVGGQGVDGVLNPDVLCGKRILLVSNTSDNLVTHRRALIEKLVLTGAKVIAAAGDAGQRQPLDDLCAEFHSFALNRGRLSPLGFIHSLFELSRLVRRVHAHVVHAFTHQVNVLSGLCRLNGARLVNAVTGLGALFPENDSEYRLLRALISNGYRLGQKREMMIFHNHPDALFFRRQGMLNAKDFTVLPGSGTDPGVFRPFWDGAMERRSAVRSAWGIGRDTVVVGMAARLLRQKGIFDLARVAEITFDKGLDICYLLAGEADNCNPGSLSADELARLGKIPGLRLSGFVQDMPGFWAGCDIAFLPSYREGFSRALQEAMACGLPVVTYDVPGCREAVETGANGWVTQKSDFDALAGWLEYLAARPEERIRMGRASRSKAEKEFDAAMIAERQIDIYRELLAQEMPRQRSRPGTGSLCSVLSGKKICR